jgi:hypothetical protein
MFHVAVAVVAAVIVPLVASQSEIALYVDSSSLNSSVPCGLSPSSPCSTLAAAYMSIPVLSNSSMDNITISLFPGFHNACDLSYFSLVSNVTTKQVASQVTIQALNQSKASITCTVSSYSRLFSVDSQGLTMTIKNLVLSIQFGGVGIEFFQIQERTLPLHFTQLTVILMDPWKLPEPRCV